MLLIDDESHTYWDHLTGEAVYGPLTGTQLDVWGIQQTTVRAARTNTPDLLVYRSRQVVRSRFLTWCMNLPFVQGWFPPGFRRTMDPVDARLDEMCLGLGVVTSSGARFYPQALIGAGLEDELGGQAFRVQIGSVDAVPYAEWTDGSRPLQLFSRWYGFSLTYPNCDIYDSRSCAR